MADVLGVVETVDKVAKPVVDTVKSAPVVGGVHSADPGMLDVDMVAPGLLVVAVDGPAAVGGPQQPYQRD